VNKHCPNGCEPRALRATCNLRDGLLQLLGCLADLIKLLDLKDSIAGGALIQHEGGGLLRAGKIKASTGDGGGN